MPYKIAALKIFAMAFRDVIHRSAVYSLLSLSFLLWVPKAFAFDPDANASALLSTADETTYAQRRSFFSREADEDWLARLLISPPKVERVFLRHNPLADQWDDHDLLVCLSRRLQDIERGQLGRPGTAYDYDLKLTFADGTSVAQGFSDMATWLISENGSSIRNRCFRIGESIVHPGRRRDDINVEGDRKFRAGGIKTVTVRIRRKDKYGEILVHEFSTADIHPYTRTTRTVYGKNGYSQGEVRLQPEFIDGRWKGEVFYLTQKCASLRALAATSPPAETEVTEYAAGFEHGYKSGERFVGKHRKACEDSLKMFGHDGYERSGLLIGR